MLAQFSVVLPGEEEDLVPLYNSLIHTLVELIVETPIGEDTYPLHMEATILIIVLLSSVMFTLGKPIQQLSAWKVIMIGNTSVLAIPLTCSLLNLLVKAAVLCWVLHLVSEKSSLSDMVLRQWLN